MNLQQFFAMSFGLSVENIYYIAIAVLACVLGAEIAGICMLIGKMRRARNEGAEATENEYNGNGGAYAMIALSFGAVSATAELVLFVLAVAVAVGAFILCLLLAILCANGYWLTPAQKTKKAESAVEDAALQEMPEQVSDTVEESVVSEEPIYAEHYADDDAAQQAIANLIATEDAALVEEYTEQEDIEDAAVEEAAQDVTAVEVVSEDPNTSVVQSTQTVERTIVSGDAPAYAGQAPFVEKHITEITKEVIKETNTTTVNTVTEGKSEPQFSPATEEMMKAITEFMKLETQLRMEREVAVERPAQADGETTPAFADAEDEDIEMDEREEDDELDAEDEAEREADEENDDDYESDLFGGNERIVGFDEETGCYIVARYRKSCEAKLIQARPATKKYYSAIRNALMGYEGTKERMSWTIDTYTNEHAQIAKINIRPRTIDLYLALEPSTLEDSVYRGRDVSSKKKYAETPFLYKVNSPRKLTLALELVQRACEEQGLSPIDIEEINYEEQYPFTDTETLVVRGLIREYLREEKPAATFELDPDHVPQLAEEDETVIPANANFTWEFDNDQPEVEESAPEEPTVEIELAPEEPVIEEEPIVEEPVAEEPVKEAPVAGTTTTTTTHETIRTTERHYTERYYGTNAQAEITEQTRTIEVLPEASAEPIEAIAEEIAPVTIDEPADAEQPTEEVMAEVLDVEEDAEEEILADVEEDIAEDAEIEEANEVQSAVAALFGDDINDEDEIIEEEIIEEEIVEEIEEVVEEEPEAEAEEEYYEEEPEAEAEEEYYEEEPEAEAEEEYYEEEPEAEAEEEYYEEEPEAEAEEEYYEESEEEVQEVYESFEEPEFEESYEEEESVEEIEEEAEEAPAPAPAPQPTTDVVLLDVCLFDDYFDNGAIVNLETLKQVGLAPESATRLKVYASGELKGQFTVEANHFTLDAIKAIGDADGDSIMIR